MTRRCAAFSPFPRQWLKRRPLSLIILTGIVLIGMARFLSNTEEHNRNSGSSEYVSPNSERKEAHAVRANNPALQVNPFRRSHSQRARPNQSIDRKAVIEKLTHHYLTRGDLTAIRAGTEHLSSSDRSSVIGHILSRTWAYNDLGQEFARKVHFIRSIDGLNEDSILVRLSAVAGARMPASLKAADLDSIDERYWRTFVATAAENDPASALDILTSDNQSVRRNLTTSLVISHWLKLDSDHAIKSVARLSPGEVKTTASSEIIRWMESKDDILDSDIDYVESILQD